MKRLVGLLLLTFGLSVLTGPAQAESGITSSQVNFQNNFPTNLVFSITGASAAEINRVTLNVQVGKCVTNLFIPTFTPATKIQATYSWDLKKDYLPPGAEGQYWWTMQDSAGGQLQTTKQPFRVDDPAHTWQKLSNNQLALFWYQGNQGFGQALFDRGLQAISFLQTDIGVSLDQQIQIFIYASHADLLQALSVGSMEWTGGQDLPEYGVVLIGVDPSNLDWGLSTTSHELTHQVVHHAIQIGCNPIGTLSLPPLMDEGLAVYNENPGKSDPQFDLSLRRAIQDNTLIPLRTLTSAFPPDPNAASLSYGESWSFVDFLIRHYGKEKIGQWLKAASVGGTIDDLFTKVYGLDLDGLEIEWRKDIGAQPRVIPTRNLSTPTAIPTLGLSTGDSPTFTAKPTSTPVSVAVNATPAPAPTTGQNGPANSVTTLCGLPFGLIALGVIGTGIWQRKRKL